MSTWTVLLRMVLAAAASLPLMGCNSGRPVPYRIERTWALVDAETASRAAFLGLPVQANPAALMARRCDASELAKLLEEAGDRKFFWSGKQGFVGRLIPGAVSPAHADTWTLSVQPGFPAACGPPSSTPVSCRHRRHIAYCIANVPVQSSRQSQI